MKKCGCIAIRENNTSRIEYCDLHASAPTLAAEVARLKGENEAMREACVSLVDACELAETSMSLVLSKFPGVERYLQIDIKKISLAVTQAKKIEALRAALGGE